MKKLLKPLLAAGMLLLAVLCFSACAGDWSAPYPSLDEEGYTVSVKYDANGGVFAGTNNVTVVDVFNPDQASTNANGEKEIHLLSPDDPLRGKESAFSISRNNYFFVGWYAERTLRVDESGNPLDEYGVPTSVSGREQGYIYGSKWNFDTDVLTVDPSAKLSSETPVMTLYAAWVPYYVYEFYAEDASTGEMMLYSTEQMVSLDIPAWDETSGEMEMENFPKREGMTFDGAYLDPEMTQPLTEALAGSIDYDKGISIENTFKIYTKWMEGNWYKIYTAEQFVDNSRIDGSYIICADLDFSDEVWSLGLSKGQFTGTILGNGHTFSNITVTQADISQSRGGLFGSLDSAAKIENLSFENVTYTVSAGSRVTAPTFGLLAGSISENAVLTDVTVSGSLLIGDGCYPKDDYQIGLLSGNGVSHGIDLSGITCAVTPENSEVLSVSVEADGSVVLTFITE